MEIDDWGFQCISVPADGSCFFTSVAVAMNDSMEKWMAKPRVKAMMKHHWERFNILNLEVTEQITPRFVRYMSASAMDEVSLVMHNEEASVLRKRKFDTPEDLAKHVLDSKCWADQSMIRSFMRSMLYMVSIVI